jgi:putative ABC transport system permease protein
VSDKKMSIPWDNLWFWLTAAGFTFFTGLISGSYPAFYLSSFRPVKVLKGTFKAGRFASIPRKVLVVLQFTVSIALIIGTIIVFRQIQHAKDRPIGYTREGLITIQKNTPELDKNYDVIRNELLRSGAIEDMALSNFKPTQITSGNIGFSLKGKAPNSLPWFGTLNVSHDFGHTIGWKVLQGRDFSRSFATDSSAIILNDTAAKQLGIKNPVGQIITYNGNIFEDNKDHVIIGVVDNMVQDSPYEPPAPVMFFLGNWSNVITLRLNRNLPAKEALAKIEGVFKIYNPASPFEYKFNDESYAEKFSKEQRIGNLATVFAILAVFISCLGLFGLASFVAEQRTKEIGVRKVLGASIFNLWRMLSKDFVILVIIACLIAGPLAWYFLHQWLQAYEYRTNISWWIFAAAGVGALLITILTISFQAIKAALMNPVKSLRTE